jgi:hypothetical protein
MRKSHVGVQTDLAKKRKEKEILEKGPDVSVTLEERAVTQLRVLLLEGQIV